MDRNEDILEKIKSQNWDFIYPRLIAHACKRLDWIGLNPTEGVSGYDPKNIVSSAIEKVLTGDRLPKPGDFENFLEYMKGIVNSLIYSLKSKKENKLKDPRNLDGALADEVFFDKILEEGFLNDEEITVLRERFEAELIEKDQDVYNVYRQLCQGQKHKTIAENMNKRVSDIENIHKRLNTFIRNFRSEKVKHEKF
jgi:hypothetical protein